MRTIWKYNIGIHNKPQHILMPARAKLLTVQIQDGNFALWAEVDTDNVKVERTVRTYPTGFSIGDNPGEYISTVQTFQGTFVWHFYDLGERND